MFEYCLNINLSGITGREIKIEIVVVPGTNSGANPISQRIGNLQE